MGVIGVRLSVCIVIGRIDLRGCHAPRCLAVGESEMEKDVVAGRYVPPRKMPIRTAVVFLVFIFAAAMFWQFVCGRTLG